MRRARSGAGGGHHVLASEIGEIMMPESLLVIRRVPMMKMVLVEKAAWRARSVLWGGGAAFDVDGAVLDQRDAVLGR